MQQRRPRLGDILDDYCPRERRITNHAVVAMIEDEVKQTRCTTCDAEHEYKQARVPASRRRKHEDAPASDIAAAASSLARMSEADTDDAIQDLLPESLDDQSADVGGGDEDVLAGAESDEGAEDEGPVHRRLIRATLPRPEGQAPERKAPDFTMRSGGRFDQRNGQRQRGRQAGQAGQPFGQPARGGQRHGSGRPGGNDGGSARPRNGNRSGNTTGQRGGHPFNGSRGSRPGGGGQGRKRGR
jgi:hypothetical protein